MTLHYRIATGRPAEQIVREIVSATSADGVNVFLDFAKRYRLDLSRQPGAFAGDRPVGYCLFMTTPAASGTVLAPPTFPDLPAGSTYDEVLVGVLRLLAEQIEPWDLAMIQAMFSDDTRRRMALFERAGFHRLAELVIMSAPVKHEPGRKADRTDLRWVPFDESQADRFGRIILETYEGSRDCPELTGLRTAREIIEGHRYSGLFEPRGWWRMETDTGDAAVLLLNRTEEDATRLELVYMGVAPSMRRKGIARSTLSQAMQVAADLDKDTLRLAVDARNKPAIRLYRSFGFQVLSRQHALAILNESRRKRLCQETP